MEPSETPSIQSSVVEPLEDETCGCHVACRGRSKTFPIKFLQRFAKPHWALALFSSVGFLQGFIVSGLVNVVLTTIEKRFGLTSADTGFILSSYNIASTIVIPLVSYVGGRGIKPLWIGLGMGIMGVGCLLFSFPHFVTETYEILPDTTGTELICMSNHTSPENPPNNSYVKFIFILAHCLNGIGTAALVTLGMAYLDENVEQSISSLYHGIYFAVAAAFGPAVGYVVGGFTLKVYTNVGTSPGISSLDPSWIGAWWLGFLVCGFLLLLLSVPLMMFPRHMPGSRELRMNRSEEMHQDGLAKVMEKDEAFGTRLKDLPTSILILLRNPAFLLVASANALDFGLISGLSAFTPKYLESMFGLTPSVAAYYLGTVVILGGALGYVIGGLVVAKADLSVNGMIRLCCASTLVALACTSIYFYTCPSIAFAGATVPYHLEESDNALSSTKFSSQCNSRCDCYTSTYNPVCGDDGITYFSSCFAGCEQFINQTYTNCSCIRDTETTTTAKTAKPGTCINTNCMGLIGFMFAVFGLLFFTVLCWTPVLQIVIRVVPFKQRSFAIGAQWVLNRCLGGIPGPIVFGQVYDLACAVWSGEDRGSCRLYFNRQMSYYTLYLVLGHKVITLVLYVLGAFLYRPSEEAKPMRRRSTASEIVRQPKRGGPKEIVNKNFTLPGLEPENKNVT